MKKMKEFIVEEILLRYFSFEIKIDVLTEVGNLQTD